MLPSVAVVFPSWAPLPKERVCIFIKRREHVMLHSSSSFTFFNDTRLCNAVMGLKALVYAGLEYVVIHDYGMKMKIDFHKPLKPLIIDVPSVIKRLDVGLTTECKGIPLFHSTQDNTYTMLYRAGLRRGSTSQCSHQGHLLTVTYPTVLHQVLVVLY